MNRPSERWSSVIAAIAVAAGVRADICMIAGAELERGRARSPPRERRERVGAVGLGGPDRVEPEPLGLDDRLGRAGRRTGRPVPRVVAELDVSHHRKVGDPVRGSGGGRRPAGGDLEREDPAPRTGRAILDVGRSRAVSTRTRRRRGRNWSSTSKRPVRSATRSATGCVRSSAPWSASSPMTSVRSCATGRSPRNASSSVSAMRSMSIVPVDRRVRPAARSSDGSTARSSVARPSAPASARRSTTTDPNRHSPQNPRLRQNF